MDKILLLVSVVLLAIAIRFHLKAKVSVKTNIEKGWFERLWSGSRPSKDNLTDEGLRYRKQSNIYAIVGLFVLGIYVLINSSA